MALFNFVQNLTIMLSGSEQHGIDNRDVEVFQMVYCNRILSWRDEVRRRHTRASIQKDRRVEVMMAILIREEELILGKRQQSETIRNERSSWMRSHFGEITCIAAVIIGINMFLKR